MAEKFGEFKSVYDAFDIQGLTVETGISGAATKLTITLAAISGGEYTLFKVEGFCDGVGSALITILDSVGTLGYGWAGAVDKPSRPWLAPKGVRCAVGPVTVIIPAADSGSIYAQIFYYGGVRPTRIPA